MVIWPPREHMVESGHAEPVVGVLQPPEYDETCFAALNDASGSPVARYGVTDPNFDFYNNYWDVIFEQLI